MRSPLAFIIIFFKDLIKIHLRFSQNTRVACISHVANCFNLGETLKLVHNMKTTFFQMLVCNSFLKVCFQMQGSIDHNVLIPLNIVKSRTCILFVS